MVRCRTTWSPLLPVIGDLDPSCTCDAWELPCQHAAGLCYQVAWLLDSDPFVLLLLRGRSREDLLDQLQSRSGTEPADAPPAGVSAADVLSEPVGALPDVPDLPGKVTLDELAVSGIEPPQGFAPATLPLLVLDAARRARALLNALLHGTPEPQPLDEWQDAVRLAADFPELTEPLAEGSPEDLALGSQAWRYGGAPGLDVLERTWTPAPAELAGARTELVAAEFTVEILDNHLTVGADIQLRLDRQGRWHPYRLVGETWTPTAPAAPDPLTALAMDW